MSMTSAINQRSCSCWGADPFTQVPGTSLAFLGTSPNFWLLCSVGQRRKPRSNHQLHLPPASTLKDKHACSWGNVLLFSNRLQFFLTLSNRCKNVPISGTKICSIILKSRAICLVGVCLWRKGYSNLEEPSMFGWHLPIALKNSKSFHMSPQVTQA